MLDRRKLMAGAGAAMAFAGLVGTGRAETARASARATVTPPKGPWDGFGSVRRAGGILHYATLGSGNSGLPPVVLLHKLGGWLSDWRFVAPALAEGRKVYAFDLPGHGGSAWDGPPPYIQTLGETAALLVGALDELGIDRIALIGTSLGGCLSVPLAAFWPERVERLALVSSALSPRRTLAEIHTAIDEKQTALYDKNGLPVPTPEKLLSDIFGIVNTHQIQIDGLASRKAAGRWIQPSERGVADFDIIGTMPRIACPTMLVYGEYDKAYVKFRSAAEAALKRSVTRVVPGAGAFVMQDQPAATATVLKGFLAPDFPKA